MRARPARSFGQFARTVIIGGLSAFSMLGLASPSGWTQTLVDPLVGFCSPPGSVTACTTATGLGSPKETIGIGATSFVMLGNNPGASASPWFLILAVPEATDGSAPAAPTITNTDGVFTLSSVTDGGDFLQTTSGSIYDFLNLSGDGSMNASNLFGANEQAAFGSVPNDFELDVYTWTPAFNTSGKTLYTFTTSGMAPGTFLAASDNGGGGGYSTPFTVTGLVFGPPTPPVPEPGTLLILGAGLVGLVLLRRRWV